MTETCRTARVIAGLVVAMAVCAGGACGTLEGEDGRVAAIDLAKGDGLASRQVEYKESLDRHCGKELTERFDHDDEGPHSYSFFGVAGERLTVDFAYDLETYGIVGGYGNGVQLVLFDADGEVVAEALKGVGSQTSLSATIRKTGRHRMLMAPAWAWNSASYTLRVGCGGKEPVTVSLARDAATLGEALAVTLQNASGEEVVSNGCGSPFFWQRLVDGGWQSAGNRDLCEDPAYRVWPDAAVAHTVQAPATGIWRLALPYGIRCSSPRQYFESNRTGCQGLRWAYSSAVTVAPASCLVADCGCVATDINGTLREGPACDGPWAASCYSTEVLECGRFAADGVSCGWRIRLSERYDNGAFYDECMKMHGRGVEAPPVAR